MTVSIEYDTRKPYCLVYVDPASFDPKEDMVQSFLFNSHFKTDDLKTLTIVRFNVFLVFYKFVYSMTNSWPSTLLNIFLVTLDIVNRSEVVGNSTVIFYWTYYTCDKRSKHSCQEDMNHIQEPSWLTRQMFLFMVIFIFTQQ